MRRLIFALLFIVPVWLTLIPARAEDGIPDNCETAAEDAAKALFARYEPHSGRLLLVDWRTGADVRVLATGLGETRIVAWSPTCRYLAVAVGSLASMDTVIFDALNGGEVGRVLDAHHKPHPVTWGPHEYVMVESRDGATLWHVPSGRRHVLAVGFNTTTMRNFSRLRWDAAAYQVVGNLAVGGRVVFDLTTGQEVAEVANPFSGRQVSTTGTPPTYTLGGVSYPCLNKSTQFYRTESTPFSAEFIEPQNSFEIRFENNGYGIPRETVLMLEDGLEVSTFHYRGGSPNCRYIIASIGIPDTDVTDTVVWDITTGQRVGVFPDARKILHPIAWSPDSQYIAITTRHGLYLWRMADDSRTLLTANVETPLVGRSRISAYTRLYWVADPAMLVIQPIGNEGYVTYALPSGEPLAIDPTPYIVADNTTDNQQTVTQSVQPNQPTDGVNGYGVNWFRSSDCSGQFIEYNSHNRTLSLIYEGERVIIGQDVNDTHGYIRKSPSCRYFAVQTRLRQDNGLGYSEAPVDFGLYERRYDLYTIWDVQTHRIIAAVPDQLDFEMTPSILWSHDERWALAYTGSGAYIVSLETGVTHLLVFSENEPNPYVNDRLKVYWDFGRGHIIVHGKAANAYAFNLYTGQQKYRFTLPQSSIYSDNWCGYALAGCDMDVTDNGKYVWLQHGSSLSLWNVDTLAHYPLRTSGSAASHLRLAVSPDERYVVAGYKRLRVWDLQNLNENGTSAMGWEIDGRIRSVRFIDNVTVELITTAGTAHLNVETGVSTPIQP